ncbi:MAG: cellulase [Acidobacteria bacterium]|nr:cellulase [Acidobacteriota bacterium]
MRHLDLRLSQLHRDRRSRSICGLFLLSFLLLSPLCPAQPAWPLWDSYNRIIIDQQGRVIDRSAQDRTTSEGQSYAMFFALVANDRARFDKLLHWTEINLAAGDLTQHLPAWSWGKAPDGSWKPLDLHPASDADLWMAYSLIEAGRLWRDPHYDRLGMALAAQVAQQEAAFVPGLGTTLIAGAYGFHPDAQTWILNPSYLQPSILARLSKVMPNGPWAAILDSLNPILAEGSGAGYAMDWVTAGSGIHPSATPSQHAAGDAGAMPKGSYDAIRVYLWLGIADPETRGVRSLLTRVPAMAAYLDNHPIPPQQVDAQGRVLNPNGSPGFSAAVTPYLRALGKTAQAKIQSDRLAASRDATTGLYGKTADYYDQNLALFATGWSEGRFRFDRDGKLRVKWK